MVNNAHEKSMALYQDENSDKWIRQLLQLFHLLVKLILPLIQEAAKFMMQEIRQVAQFVIVNHLID